VLRTGRYGREIHILNGGRGKGEEEGRRVRKRVMDGTNIREYSMSLIGRVRPGCKKH